MEYVTFGELAIPIQAQAGIEREWQQVSLRQLYELPREPGIELYMPGPFTLGSDGALYYMDPGDMKIKHFDADGYFKQSYGGLGEGPGKFNIFTEADIIGDSVLYVNDPNRRTVSFFAVDSATFLYSIPNIHAHKYKITQGGRAYWIDLGGDSLLGTSVGEHNARFFGQLITEQTQAHILLKGGHVIPYQEDIIYVSSRFPILMRYDSTGTMIYARATPDFERAEPPSTERLNTSTGFVARMPSRSINGHSEVYGDKLVVYADVSASEKAFDVYDAATGDYEYSISLPWGRIYFASYDLPCASVFGRFGTRLWRSMPSTLQI